MNKRKETTFFGNEITLLGEKQAVGNPAPDFTCLDQDLKPVTLNDFKGKVKLISVVPSIDTGVCELQTIRFNQEAGTMDGAVILTVSCDLPFALGRFCAAKGIENAKVMSDHKDLSFGLNYGFVIEEFRLLNRGIVVIDKDNVIRHIEYVAENTNHPDYDAALGEVKKLI
ncbi:MAG: thiol peroxidase [Eubacteriales bacterium]|nr:thiol peroxidase [Eubacteriales bacterium]